MSNLSNELKQYAYEKDTLKTKLGQFCHFKLLISFSIWLTSYVMMGVFGGAVAFYHFPRVFPRQPRPDPLPDFGYDIVPYFCPSAGISNPQSIILLLFYLFVFLGACNKPAPQGRLAVQQLLHLNTLVFLMRTTTVGLTGLPQPNPRCVDIQSIRASYLESIEYVFRHILPHACGDLVFSGHISCMFMCVVVYHRRKLFKGILAYAVIWFLALLGTLAVISCRSHYSVDVMLAFYFVYFIQDWYYSRGDVYAVNRNYNQTVVSCIAWLEDRRPTQELNLIDSKGKHMGFVHTTPNTSDDSASEGSDVLFL